MKKPLTVCLALFTATLLVLAGYFWGTARTEKYGFENESSASWRQKGGEYTYISPLLECNTLDDLTDQTALLLKSRVRDFISREQRQHPSTKFSVYFRDLNNGPWFGINERENFSPGSLLKMPFMMSFYKLAETNPKILEETIRYDGKVGDIATQHFSPGMNVKEGKNYTVDELIRIMIQASSNEAALILAELIDPTLLRKTYTDLALDPPQSSEYIISVKQYAAFFRILFNATYLNRDYSEKALSVLADSFFDQGLRANIPRTIPIAHKFGERTLEKNKVQFHDCGIVYYPRHPYLLCVMTQGEDLDRLSENIQEISNLIFETIDKQRQTDI